MAHAHYMLDAKGYKHIFRICNTYCFPLLQWLHERASMLRFTFVALLVCLNILLQRFILEPGEFVVKVTGFVERDTKFRFLIHSEIPFPSHYSPVSAVRCTISDFLRVGSEVLVLLGCYPA
jgi:hypothetical protein